MATKWNDRAVLEKVRSDLRGRMQLVGEFVEGSAKLRAPVDTGFLRASITHKVIAFDTVIIGTAVEYAAYQEFGTVKMVAQPFLRPAVYENKAAIKRIIGS